MDGKILYPKKEVEENKPQDEQSGSTLRRARFEHTVFTLGGNSDQHSFVNPKSAQKLDGMRRRYGLSPQDRSMPSASEGRQIRVLDANQVKKIYQVKHKIKESEANLEKITQFNRQDPHYLVRHLIDKETFDTDIEKIGEIRREASACIQAHVIDRDLTEFLWELNQAYTVLKKYLDQLRKQPNKINEELQVRFNYQEVIKNAINKDSGIYTNKFSDDRKQEFKRILISAENAHREYLNTVSKKEAYIQICKANEGLLDVIGRQETEARREQIEKLLKDLPEPGSRPTLHDLDKRNWWPLYIGKKWHREAKERRTPGQFFDQKGSLGHQQSMTELFETMLLTAKPGEYNDMDYDGYTEFHKLATRYITPDNKRNEMRQSNRLVRNSIENFAYGYLLPVPMNDPEPASKLQERRLAFKEMYEERINGLPLLQEMPGGKDPPLKPDWLGGHTIPRPEEIPQGIVGYIIRFNFNSQILLVPLYSLEEGKEHVNAILKSYYQGRKVSNQTEYQRLREIARAIRALNMVHQKFDGIGRTNGYGLLNKWLLEEGFSPTILPNGSTAFGGEQSLDGLVKDMLVGMHEFISQVNQGKQNSGHSQDNSSFLEITPA